MSFRSFGVELFNDKSFKFEGKSFFLPEIEYNKQYRQHKETPDEELMVTLKTTRITYLMEL